MKLLVLLILTILGSKSFAQGPCDPRPGTSIGIKVMEFASGNTIHSKIPYNESTPDALLEEMINLQEMGVCEEKILTQKCILRSEKKSKLNLITLYRGGSKWNSWNVKGKKKAENFVKNLKRVGFCS